MRLSPFALIRLALLVLSSGIAQATVIVPTYSATYNGTTNLNNVTLTLASTIASPTNPTTISVEDVRGTAAITDTSTSSFYLLYAGSAPLPNSLLVGLNGTLSQEVLLSFDLAPADLGYGTPFFTGNVVAAAIGVPVGTVTDPTLKSLIGITFFDFTYEPNASNPGAGVLTYGLSAVLPTGTPTPEPSALLLFSFGSAALLVSLVKSKMLGRT